MTIERIGAAAGVIWRRLSEEGELTLSELKKTPCEFTCDEVIAGLGWLAREGKVSVDSRSRRHYVSLAEESVVL